MGVKGKCKERVTTERWMRLGGPKVDWIDGGGAERRTGLKVELDWGRFGWVQLDGGGFRLTETGFNVRLD